MEAFFCAVDGGHFARVTPRLLLGGGVFSSRVAKLTLRYESANGMVDARYDRGSQPFFLTLPLNWGAQEMKKLLLPD